MYYSNIKTKDISNGTGIRTSIYVSGCRNYCKGCFNPETWNFNNGEEFTKETLQFIIDSCKPSYVKGLTILGGEPLEPENQKEVLNIIKEFKRNYKDKDIWLFSGYIYEDQIKKWCEELPYTKEIIENIDVLVDGKFDIEKKDVTLSFRGSSNQRILDIKKTISDNEISYHFKHNELKKVGV